MALSKLILKNTIYLYIRQILVLFVALYTTRIVFNTLGVEDFGLYNLIAGVVSMLSILTASMTSATQRFLAISLGKEDNNIDEFRKVFNVCFTLFVVLSLIVFLFAETIGVWFVNAVLNIPNQRVSAANWTFQFAVFSFILNLLRVPYNAAIIAFEKMDFYAWVSVAQVFCQLLVAYSLFYVEFDHLIVYSFLLLIVVVLINFIYFYYCFKKLQIRHISLSLDRNYFNSIFSFSFWTFFGSLSTIGSRQGTNILINRYFGVLLNAASGISTKVSGVAYDFVANFTTAYRPRLLKLYASNDEAELYDLIYKTTKLSCYLFMIIMIPIQLNFHQILYYWLGQVPEYADIFCSLLIIYLFIDAMQSPLMVMVHAIGNIRNFQIIFSVITLLNIPIMWFLLSKDFPPESVYVVYILINVVTSCYRAFYVKNRSNLKLKVYVQTILRVLLTMICAYSLSYLFIHYFVEQNSLVHFIYKLLFSFFISLISIFFIGFSISERIIIYCFVKRKLKESITLWKK